MKRLISGIMAMTMTVSAISIFNTSAIALYGEKEKAEETMNEKFTHALELVDIITKIDGVEKEWTEDLWITSIENNVISYISERKIDDYINFNFSKKSEDLPDIAEILRKNLGYSGKFEIKEMTEDYDGTLIILIDFLTDDHNLNYMLAEKAYSILKDYSVTGTQSAFDKAQFYDFYIIMPEVPVEKWDEVEKLTIEDSAMYNKIFEESKIRVRYMDLPQIEKDSMQKTVKYAVFPEDMTDREKLEYTFFVQENFGITPYVYYQFSENSVGSSLDTTADNWLNGDANCDGEVNIADATSIIQAIGNPDKYKLTAQGEFNADINGDGLTGLDAMAIQKFEANIIKNLSET